MSHTIGRVLVGVTLAGLSALVTACAGSGTTATVTATGATGTGSAGSGSARSGDVVINVGDQQQEPRLLQWQRVLPNVSLGLKPGPDGRAALRRQSLDALGEVGLADHARAWPVTLSGGEAQRVALARALVREPALMLLDEPFGAIDALTRTRMHGLLQDLCARHQPAVLLVTHDVDEAVVLADRVLVLVNGAIGIDLPVGLPRPRDRGAAAFTELRTRLLAGLSVAETPEESSQRMKALVIA